ncbi:MAG: endonuclease, partial [Bdellovibrio sp. CG_4_9_14_3_um_filter_39_7]
RSGVSIPERYYKIPYFPDAGIMRAYLIENDNQNGVSYTHFQVSVDQIETETGLDFFSQLPDSIEDTLESELR